MAVHPRLDEELPMKRESCLFSTLLVSFVVIALGSASAYALTVLAGFAS